MESIPLRKKILETIVSKSTLKQKVFDNTFATFNDLKETLLEMASEMDDQLDGLLDRRVRLEYRDRGKFEAPDTGGQRPADLPDAHRRLRVRAEPRHLAESLRADGPGQLLLRRNQHLQLPFGLVQVQPQCRRRLPHRPHFHQP